MKLSRRSLFFYFSFTLILLAGFWLRWRNIDTRPMHGDEANQAYQFQMLLEDNNYKYEPDDFHGPTLYYLAIPYFKIFGPAEFKDADKRHLRGLTVVFALLTVVASLLLTDAITRTGVLLFALFQMISPAMIFYSTYFIQETLLVCFTVYFAGSIWRFIRKPSILWALNAGIALGLLHATKETFILSLFALFCAFAVIIYLKGKPQFLTKTEGKHLAFFFLAALTVSVLFYSSFLSNPKGPVDSVKSFTSQIKRGLGSDDFPEHMTSGAGHSKGFFYYFNNIRGYYPRKMSSTVKDISRNSPARPLTEVFFILTTLTGLLFIKRTGRQWDIHKTALVFTIILALTYSFIPYKTPWCMLSFLTGFMLCAALAVKGIINEKGWVKWALLIPMILLSVDLGRQAMLINSEEFATSDRNQYAYVQPVFDVEDTAARIKEFSRIEGSGTEMQVHFLTPEYWPLPWYIKDFKNIGYWENKIPEEPKWDISVFPVVVSTPDRDDVAELLSKTHYAELRSRVQNSFVTVYYRNDLWSKFISNR